LALWTIAIAVFPVVINHRSLLRSLSLSR
jgi:hypothetical protein